MGQVRIPLFKKADLDATIGVFFDGFSKVIVALSVLVGTFGLDASTVFGTMMPGLLVTVIVLNGGMWVYYRHVAKQRGDANLTAIPAGLQAGRMFIWLFSIMLPVYQATGDAMLAFKVGVLAHFFSGLVFLIGAFVVPCCSRSSRRAPCLARSAAPWRSSSFSRLTARLPCRSWAGSRSWCSS